MIIQTLDIKDNCTGVFVENSFLFNNFDNTIKQAKLAWKHSPVFDDEKIEYLYVYLKGNDLSPYAFDSEMYEEYKLKMESHAKAAKVAKVQLEDLCFFDIIPEHQLLKWFSIRGQCMNKLHRAKSRPTDYSILHKAHVLATEISHNKIKFGTEFGRVRYNIFGSATGRLTTLKNSVPVLTLKKEQRSQLTPNNDMFLDLDINAAELRTLLALSGQEQPDIDLHEWNASELFNSSLSRSEAKQRMFAWLYNPVAIDESLEQCYNREIFRDFFSAEDQLVTTPFGRKLYVEEKKAQNYLLQSTTSDIVIENAYKIMKLLKNRRSNIAFTLHDSVILDFAKEDHDLVREIKETFETNRYGRFLSTIKIGKNFGEMRDLVL
ncbi:MAG TPA: hypothetical protein DCM40_42985 [Maribacter sp.]|nr:hypothetical protein [Maribacter sp.]